MEFSLLPVFDLFLLLLLFWLNQIPSFFLLACLNGTQFDLCQSTSAQIAMEEKRKKKSTLGDKKSCWRSQKAAEQI